MQKELQPACRTEDPAQQGQTIVAHEPCAASSRLALAMAAQHSSAHARTAPWPSMAGLAMQPLHVTLPGAMGPADVGGVQSEQYAPRAATQHSVSCLDDLMAEAAARTQAAALVSASAQHLSARSPLAEANGRRGASAGASAVELAPKPPQPSALAAARRIRVPHIVTEVRSKVQEPPPGQFDVKALQWAASKNSGNAPDALVAAVRKARFADFLQGEQRRGQCVLNKTTEHTSAGVLMNERWECVYGSIRKKVQQGRVAVDPSNDPVPLIAGTAARRGTLQSRDSVKKECSFGFRVKEYSALPDVAIIKFSGTAGCMPQACMSMRHCTPAGVLAHEGSRQHLHQYTDEFRDYVINRCREQVKPAIIRQGAHALPIETLPLASCKHFQ